MFHPIRGQQFAKKNRTSEILQKLRNRRSRRNPITEKKNSSCLNTLTRLKVCGKVFQN